jgi:hypothetical protein
MGKIRSTGGVYPLAKITDRSKKRPAAHTKCGLVAVTRIERVTRGL